MRRRPLNSLKSFKSYSLLIESFGMRGERRLFPPPPVLSERLHDSDPRLPRQSPVPARYAHPLHSFA